MEDDKNSIVNIPLDGNTKNLVEVWGTNPALFGEVQKNIKIYSYKHGMFASIPIICKGKDCPYKDVCTISAQNRTIGQRCPMEIAAIIARFDYWCSHFEIDISQNRISPEDATDVACIRDLVDNEIQILRCENKIALTGDFIGKTIADVDKKGVEHYEDAVTPEASFKLELQNKRYKILQLLHSTREDKAKEMQSKNSISKESSELIKKVQNIISKHDLLKLDSDQFDVHDAVDVQITEDKEKTNTPSLKEIPDDDLDDLVNDLDSIFK